MKAISIHQPYASFIVAGLKNYETRTWKPHRGILGTRIAIHASKTTLTSGIFCDPNHCDEKTLADRKYAMGCINWGKKAQPHGAIICTAIMDLVMRCDSECADNIDGIEKALGAWSNETYAWRLNEVEVLTDPIPYRGQQSFFNIPDKLIPEYAR